MNKTIHGFEFIKDTFVPEISGTAREARHKKSGAKLLFIDREDNNKTFAIAFKTIPEDDTGVFHILEHSVLCGSDKYPVKEPFVELLKGSLKTFLNAMTYNDKTVYPVSSRNDKDFLNLVSVYMDAVLHPLAVKDERIFMQEGWHYELHSPEDEMIYKGVVFNEMKGAYSSADEVEFEEMTTLLYKDTCYAKDSGGNPKAIPSLTYEKFVAAHEKYYHPSNSMIILDGSVDLDKTLMLLDSFLLEYDSVELSFEIPRAGETVKAEKTIKYEISEGEDPEGKARICLGFMGAPFDDRRTLMALGIITDAIAGTNESPFKKAMLDSGVCEDVGFMTLDAIADNSLLLEIRNVKEERLAEAKETALAELRKIAESGIRRDALRASFNLIEFRLREADMGTTPSGLAYALATLDTWLYGGDPVAPLRFEDDIAALRLALDTDYYERLLERVCLDGDRMATLYMLPSSTLGEERAALEKETLANAKAKMTDSEISEIIRKTLLLEEWQKKGDTPEQLATLPSLSIEDISADPEPYPTEEFKVGNTPVVHIDVKSRGITYYNLLFDLSDFSSEELFYASLLSDLLKNLPTEKRDAASLQTAVKSELGSFSLAVMASTKNKKTTPYMRVGVSALDSKLDSARQLLEEILLKTVFSDTEAIGRIVRQLKTVSQESMAASGSSVAFARSAAYVDPEAAVSEYIDGVEFYLALKALDSAFAERSFECGSKLRSVYEKMFKRGRLTAFVSGKRCDGDIEKLLWIFPDSIRITAECTIKPLGIRNEGILIPASVSFAARAVNCLEYCDRIPGSIAAVRTVLSYAYLWSEIRVQGGAYGAGFIKRNNGLMGYYTYRDPDANRSIEVFSGAADFLRSIAHSGEDLTTYIIGAVGDGDPLLTPKVVSALAMAAYLRGETYSERAEYRRELIGTNAESLLKIADIIEKIAIDGGICVVGGRDKLDACGDKISSVIEL
ncbi:MAG: insulinase family protein [Clostridia bacterium]|nr:insulinase family protein [Clostridia bacterium]